jgi:hypothetical protein
MAASPPPQKRFGLTLFKDPLPVLPVRHVSHHVCFGHKTLRIAMVDKQVQLHSDLPGKTRLWGVGAHAGLSTQ